MASGTRPRSPRSAAENNPRRSGATERALTQLRVYKLVNDLDDPVPDGVLPLKAQLSQRAYRLVLAASVREALAAMQAGGINPAKIGKVRPQIIPAVVSLPDWLFRLVAANMLKIDEEARSSMAEDLDAGRKPEIDWLNGEIVRLGLRTGIATPVNAKLSQMVNRAFAEGKSPNLSGAELLRKVGL